GDKINKGDPLVEIEASGASECSAARGAPSATVDTVSASGQTAAAPADQAASAVAPAAPAAQAGAGAAPGTSAAPTASSYSGNADIECDVLVLGAGPGGYSAAFRAADLGLNVVLVERYPTLGGVCLNVGCIPSKALLHSVAVLEEARSLAAHGIAFGEPQIDLDKLRAYKDGVIGKLTGGLAGMARARKVTV